MADRESKKSSDATPTIRRGSLRKTLAVYVGGNSFAMVFRILAGFLSTRCVEPSALGLFGGFSLVLGYIPFLGLGVFEGLNRELPYYHGKNNEEKTRALPGASQAWAMLLGTTCAAILFSLAIWCMLSGQWMNAAGWASAAVLSFLLFVEVNHLQTLYRVYDRFSHLARASAIQATVSLVFVLAVLLFQFYGLCIRAVAVGLVPFVLLWATRPARGPAKFEPTEIKELAKAGFPIMLITQVSMLWFVLNRTLILHFMGTESLGLYALYPMMLPALNLLPLAVSQTVYPRISEMHGKDQGLRDILKYTIKPLALLVLGMIPVVLFIWFALPFAVKILLPKYVEGVQAARWALLDIFIICLMQIRIVFFTIRKQNAYLVGLVIGMVAYVAALMYLTRETMYLEAFPQAMLFGRVIYIFFCLAMLLILIRQDKHQPTSG